MFADLPSKYRSGLHVIQLAALCKVPDLQRCGYQRAFGPLLQDLKTLEQDGVFIECLGKSLQGAVLCIVSDNLAAHSLAGFSQSFRTGFICRFCNATQDLIQSHDVGDGKFSLRTKASYDHNVQEVLHGDGHSQEGVQGKCILTESLQ